jgi:hypothetical protein
MNTMPRIIKPVMNKRDEGHGWDDRERWRSRRWHDRERWRSRRHRDEW